VPPGPHNDRLMALFFSSDIPYWISKHVDHDVLKTPRRFTTRHKTQNHVAMIFKGRKLLAIGQNKVGGRNTIHAEVDAIKAVGDTNKLRGALMVVIRIGSQGSLQNSAPCESCRVVIRKCEREYGMIGCIHS